MAPALPLPPLRGGSGDGGGSGHPQLKEGVRSGEFGGGVRGQPRVVRSSILRVLTQRGLARVLEGPRGLVVEGDVELALARLAAQVAPAGDDDGVPREGVRAGGGRRGRGALPPAVRGVVAGQPHVAGGELGNFLGDIDAVVLDIVGSLILLADEVEDEGVGLFLVPTVLATLWLPARDVHRFHDLRELVSVRRKGSHLRSRIFGGRRKPV